ncbi:MAG: hypothetical protein PHU85_20430, partial [Phycisphaerae bacterium]|nr:hypothetical protein [Phycisphaerae bacterium]
GKIELRNNLIKDLTAEFVDPAHGDLRLKPPAVDARDKAARLDDANTDIDRAPRPRRPTLGAHEPFAQ